MVGLLLFSSAPCSTLEVHANPFGLFLIISYCAPNHFVSQLLHRIVGKFRGRKFYDLFKHFGQTFHGFNCAILNFQKISLAGKLLS